MLKKVLLLSTSLLLLLAGGWESKNIDANYQTKGSMEGVEINTTSMIFLPLVMSPWLDSTFGLEIATLSESVAEKAVEAGSAWARLSSLTWAFYQPVDNTEFRIDTVLEQELITANQNGQKVILIIQKAPLWAREYADSVCGPIRLDMLDEFANFMRMVVQKYSQSPYNVKYYELWNEPDLPVTRDNPATIIDESNMPYGCLGKWQESHFGGEYYAEVLKKVVPAMRAENPTVKIVLGGLLLDCDPNNLNCGIPNMSSYFEGILLGGGGPYFDLVSFHGYNYFHPTIGPIQREYEQDNWRDMGGQVEGKLKFLNEVMAQYNITKPIVMTEAGLLCPNCSPLPEQFQQDKAEYVVWLYVRNWSKGIMATTWFTLDKGGWRGSGLLDTKNIPTPAYFAYKTMTHTLYAAVYTQEVNLAPNVRVFEFNRGLKVWVLFSWDGTPKTINLTNTPASNPREIFDLYGNACNGTNCTVSGNWVTFDQPIYILFNN